MELTYNHRVPVQLRFNDADALGHINKIVLLLSSFCHSQVKSAPTPQASARNPTQYRYVSHVPSSRARYSAPTTSCTR